MPQMCPSCSRDNPDGAFTCAACSEQLHGLLGSNTLLANRYRVTRVLGCGGMGAVYLAEDSRIAGRLVAIKENLDSTAQAQFQAEIALMTGLSHPGLPGISDQFVGPNGRQYLVMNYIPGDTLQDAVTRRGPLPEAEVAALAGKLLEILEYLHAHGIIHRDVKPENIKLATNGQPVLVDFGIAKQWIPGGKTQPWAHGVGSPGFAPPEQYIGGTDQRADLYGLGAVMYFLVTAQTPPEATKLAAGAPLTPPRQIRPSLSLEMQRVIFRAMAPGVSQRYQSTAEMRQGILGSAPARTPPTLPAGQMPIAVTPPGRTGRKPWAVFASVAAGILVLALVVSLSRNGFGPRATATPAATRAVAEALTSTLTAATDTPLPTQTEVPPTVTSPTVKPPTPTSVPSSTPTPQPEPPTASPTPFPSPTLTPRAYAQAADGGALVWEGPGEEYAPMAQINADERVMITGRDADCSWFQVTMAGGRTGWAPVTQVNANVAPCEPPVVATQPPPTETPPAPPTPEPVKPTAPPAGLASNTSQFSDGQGRYGWWYQVEKGRNSGQFEDFPSFGWYGTPTRNCWQTGQEGHVRICELGEVHPGVTGRVAYRWRSEVERNVTAAIHAHKIDTSCGDGVWIGVFHVPQGQPPRKVGEFAIAGNEYRDRPANIYTYGLSLAAGDSVMVMVDIRGNSGCDQTRLYIDLY